MNRHNRDGWHGAGGPADLGPVLMVGNVPFRSMWQRTQRFAVGLSAMTGVTFVDPNRSVLQSLRRRAHVQSPPPPPPNLTLIRPPAGLPAARSCGLFNRLNYAACHLRLRRAEAVTGPPSAVIVSFPDQLDLLAHYPDVPVIYDLMDEPELFLKPHQRPRYARLHAELLERADAVMVSAHVLMDRCRIASKRAEWVSNGVPDDLAHALRIAKPDPILEGLPGPIFGYLGMIGHWMDFDAVAAIAVRNPHASVVMVGPVETRPPNLPRNVIFTGPVWGTARLAGVLNGFDVGLIPFKRTKAIDAVNPLKLYEYLSAGLPVLSAGFEEIRRYRPLVRTYETAAEAAYASAELVASPSTPREVADRRAFANGHRWAAKVARLAELLREVTGVPRIERNPEPLGVEASSPSLLCAS